jgi:hypothetical protein
MGILKLITIALEFLSKLFDFEVAKKDKKEREADAKDAQEQRDKIEINPADSFIEHFNAGMSKAQSSASTSTGSDEADAVKRSL